MAFNLPCIPGVPWRTTLAAALSASLIGVAVSASEPTVDAEAKVSYERDVRPILKAACFQCHGEGPEVEAGLDLRQRRRILAGGESGPAIVPGQLEQSLLYQRVHSGEMPPEDAHLTQQQIRTIAAWIRSGARTLRPEPADLDSDGFTASERDFWSLRPVQRPAMPRVAAAHRVRTPIDTFVLARLEAQQRSLSRDAKAEVLIRRVYFDLIGLPPAPQAVEAFVADPSATAYEQLVERLLASPHYGERWGRHWLDVAGYADSEGYTDSDPTRDSAFRYRDYVIRAWNADMPFDRFVREQLAGDEMLPLPYTNLQPNQIAKLTATGFLRMAPDGTGANGIDEHLASNRVMSETIKIVSTAMLGLTVGCAECHNHRYDPITQADYYRMRAIFEPAYDWKRWRSKAQRRISLYNSTDRQQAAVIEAEAKKVDAVRAKQASEFISQTLEKQLLSVPEPIRDALRTAYQTPNAKRTSEQKALLDRFPKILKISEGSLYLYDREIRDEASKLDSQRKEKQREFVQRAVAAQIAALPEDVRADVRAAVDKPAAQRDAKQKQLLSRFPGLPATAETLATFDAAAAAELQRLKQAADDLRKTQKADKLKTLQQQAADIRKTKKPEGFVRALTEVPGQIPVTFLFDRGDHEQPRQELAPAGLSILSHMALDAIPGNASSLPTSGRRLSFARRLTDGRHPLTARVLVNRLWTHHFGRGIVDTPGDFGALGSRPTHPQLLDWLAAELIAGDWSMKRIQRLILLSSTYRQSSGRPSQPADSDFDNRLLGRMSVRRLDAETLRDSLLSVTGQLTPKLFGPPVPVMEDAVGQIIIGQENLDGERKPGAVIPLHGEEYRRSIYVQVRRSRPLGVLATFDAPEMSPNCTQRNFSTVAPQALLMMNSRFALDHATMLAKRIAARAPQDLPQQARQGWRLCFAQDPSTAQSQAAVEFLQQQRAHFERHPVADKKTTAAMAALSSYCHALISSNRFLYID